MKSLLIKSCICLGIFLSSCSGNETQSKEEKTANKEKLQHNIQRASAKYVCPMQECKNGHSMLAGKCPDCGMDLVPNKDFVEDTIKGTAAPH